MNCTKPNAGCETTLGEHGTNDTGTNSRTTGSRKKKTKHAIANCGNLAATLLTDLSSAKSVATSAGVPSVWDNKSQARRDWLESIVAEWETANNAVMPIERLLYFAEKLDKCQYPESLAKLAEQWILLGEASTFKNLKWRHFFPTPDELKSINVSIPAMLKAEREAGFADGRRVGYDEALDAVSEEVKFRELVSRTEQCTRDALRTRALRAREIAMDESVAAMAAERRRMAQQQRRNDRRIRTVLSQLCPQCHATLSAVYPSLYSQYGGV